MQKSDILFEDNHLIIINKKPGELVQGDKTGDKPLLDKVKEYIKENENKPGNVYLGLIHRLDRPTSGIVIFAKTSKALTRMNEKFKNREIDKTYWAITTPLPEDTPTENTLTHYLKKNEKRNLVTAFPKPTQGAKKAILHYKLIQKLDNYQVFEIELETGRSHQIRVQMSKIGAPIKGDLKYGSPRSNKDGGIHLHARKVVFKHPVTQHKVEVMAKPPSEVLWDLTND
ncbi:RNA pseudouridine synthase [Flavobacteriaceae bacterium Ap0902]|nr:RNA pseudouridine synthase [Flavobacteriaceae bacterium Ap0902]